MIKYCQDFQIQGTPKWDTDGTQVSDVIPSPLRRIIQQYLNRKERKIIH